MTQEDPSSRPTAKGAQKMFNEIMKQQSKRLLRRRLTPQDPEWIGSAYRAVLNITDEIAFEVNRIQRTFAPRYSWEPLH